MTSRVDGGHGAANNRRVSISAPLALRTVIPSQRRLPASQVPPPCVLQNYHNANVKSRKGSKKQKWSVWERWPSKIERKNDNHPVDAVTHVASDITPILSPDQQSSCALMEIDLHNSLLGSNRSSTDMLSFENNSVHQYIYTTPHDDDSLMLRHPNGMVVEDSS